MSDSYITICTKKITDNPYGLSDSLLTWLQKNQIIEKKLYDDALEGGKLQYKPGERYKDAIGSRYHSMGDIEISIGRQVVTAGGNTSFSLVICPKCNMNRFTGNTQEDINNLTLDENEYFEIYMDKISEWYEGKDT